jgi:hypothetical protein
MRAISPNRDGWPGLTWMTCHLHGLSRQRPAVVRSWRNQSGSFACASEPSVPPGTTQAAFYGKSLQLGKRKSAELADSGYMSALAGRLWCAQTCLETSIPGKEDSVVMCGGVTGGDQREPPVERPE